ncbi:MAG TPA: hypothetical protein VF412_02695 [Bdellovibrio sp.]
MPDTESIEGAIKLEIQINSGAFKRGAAEIPAETLAGIPALREFRQV